MGRADGGPSPDVIVLATSLLGVVVAHLDLFGADLGLLADWGDVSLFSYATVVALLVPAVVVVRQWSRHGRLRKEGRGPDVIIGAAAAALACDVVAHLVGEGAVPGLLAVAAAAGVLGVTAVRHRA